VIIRPKIEFLPIGIPTCGRGKWIEGQYCALHSTVVYQNNWPASAVRSVWQMLIGSCSSKHRSFVWCHALCFGCINLTLLELRDAEFVTDSRNTGDYNWSKDQL